MKSKLAWIFRTYWISLLGAIPIAIVAAFTVALFYQGVSRRIETSPIEPELMHPQKSLYVNSEERRARLERYSLAGVRTITLTVTPGHLIPDLSEFSDLQALKLSTPRLDSEQFNQITAIPKLKSLLLHVSELPQGGLAELGSRLEELEIPSFVLLEHADELSSLRKLRLLRLDQTAVTAEMFAAVATIPNLKTLVLPVGTFVSVPGGLQIQNVTGYGELEIAEQALRPLIEHPHLREVYARWSPRLEKNHSLLSAVHAYPISYNRHQTRALWLASLLMVTVAATLFFQLAAQFLMSTAMVIPGYLGPHILAAVLILISGATLAVAGMLFSGISFLPATVCALFYPCLLGVIVWLSSPAPDSPLIKRVAAPLRLILLIGGIWPSMLVEAAPDWLAGLRTWFLASHYPAWTSLILLGELIFLVGTFHQLRPIVLRIQEVNPTLVGAQILDLWGRQPGARSSQTTGWPWGGSDAQLAKLAYHQGDFWKQVALLRLGNPYRPVRLIGMVVILGLLGGALFNPNQPSGEIMFSWANFKGNPVVGFFLVEAAIMGLAVAASNWFQRRKSLEMEFCWPVNRRDFTRQLFWGLALDQSIALIPLGLLAGYFLWSAPALVNTPYFYSTISLVVATALGAFATGAACFAFQRIWPICVLVVIELFAFIFCAGFLSLNFNGRRGPLWLMPSLLTLSALLLAILAVLFTARMYRKCRDREWG